MPDSFLQHPVAAVVSTGLSGGQGEAVWLRSVVDLQVALLAAVYKQQGGEGVYVEAGVDADAGKCCWGDIW
ncbi:MAG: hypothetical protein RKH07_01665 [Gammaproteobacteria bacterium]